MTKRAEFALSIDATPMIATGHVAPVNVYDPNLPPGAPRQQERDQETGLPLWVADFMINDGGERANVAGVRIASAQQPVFKQFDRVNFSWLWCAVYVNRAGQLGLNYVGGLAPAAQANKAA